ncbi:MAG: Ig-like domain-containing protein, partial [Betaproteobacteria bacterium]|nr:Ig-like domain-containing protein [Betaproteobacteria bacterium]
MFPGRGRGILGGARSLALAAVPALLLSLAAPDANASFATECDTGCHGVGGLGATSRRINAADSTSVIARADAVHLMGTNAANWGTIATEIGNLIGRPFTQTFPVNFGSTGNSITVDKIHLPGSSILTTLERVSGPTSVAFTAGSNSLTYDHTAGNCANQTLVVRGTGGSGGTLAQTSDRTITITVSPPSAPAASNAIFNIGYSTGAQTLDFNPFVSGTTPTVTMSIGGPSPAFGSLSATGVQAATYASSASVYAPTVTSTYSVTGPCSTTSTTRTVTINVGVPPAPTVANVGPSLVPAGIATLIDLTASISGVTASSPAVAYALNASQPTAPGSGTTSVAGNVVTYTPGAGFAGLTTFTYTKDGPGGTSNTGTVTLNVTAAPIVAPASVTTAFNTAIPVNLATACGGSTCITSTQPVTAVTPSGAVLGTAIQTGATTITFTPTAGLFGAGSFLYTATNVGGTSASPALVSVTVNPPPPTVAARAVTVPYNGGSPVVSTTIDLATSIGPPGATVLSVTPSGAVGGTVVATGSTTVSFTPTPGLIGAASFVYSATNAGGASAGTATVSVTVAPPAPPVARSFDVLVSNTTPTPIDLAQAVSGGPYSSLAIDSQPGAGSVTLVGTMATYTPAPGYTGNAVFLFRAFGPGGVSAPATVRLVYTAAPVTANRSLVVPFNGTGSIDLTNAFSGLITGFSISRPPANGSAVLDGGPVVTYTPNTGYFGADSFQFTAVGPGGTSVPGTVSITVNPPVATVTGLDVIVPFETTTVIDLARAITG